MDNILNFNGKGKKIITPEQGDPSPLGVLMGRFELLKQTTAIIFSSMLSDIYNIHTPAEMDTYQKEQNEIDAIINESLLAGVAEKDIPTDIETQKKLTRFSKRDLNLRDIRIRMNQLMNI